MKVKIGFLHNKENIRVKLNGNFSVRDIEDNEICRLNNEEFNLSIIKSSPATYDWYEKVDTFFDFDDFVSIKEKYHFDDTLVRIVKAGKQINEKFDNFEYWVLKKLFNFEDKFYKRGDFKYKKITKRESSGYIGFNDKKILKKIKFIPLDNNASFYISDVVIGISFHWEYKEQLEYNGELEVIIDNDGLLTAVNGIELEEYLASVNSSEMRNDNNIEMLKAQTIAARGTVLATMGKHHYMEGFDLCADDHCQCYQGTKRISDLSRNVTESTSGEVLIYDKKICDTRYAKICGGVTEKYSVCWEDYDHNYLKVFRDDTENTEFDLESEENVKSYIDDNDYDCYCNTKKYKLPESLEFCNDNFRWSEKIEYSKLKELVHRSLGDIGEVLDLKPVKRGPSGRIYELEVIGSKQSVTVSKELKIRKLLSDSHLRSSCFYLDKEFDGKNLLSITIIGAGWGHGVGLCQVGAQVMGDEGFNYQDILFHYYRGSKLIKLEV